MRIHSNIPGPLLSRLRREFRLDFFVETGTGNGDTTELAAIYFDRVFTCDIDAQLIARAQVRLADYANIQFYHLPSPKFIRRVRPSVSQPALWWLDAHWCGGRLKPKRECPLLEELKEIGGTYGHSIILIDDAQLFLSPPPPPHDPAHWPTMAQVYAAIDAWGEDVDKTVEQGPKSKILVVTPRRHIA